MHHHPYSGTGTAAECVALRRDNRWLGNNFDPSISWKDLEWIRDFWDGPMVIKGILDPEDARDAVRFGADGIVVSNHGGRQLDGVL
ncbi:alpha-hydroxy-acid oxidizing protein, partial [Escherichia sp. TWPC-MK]